MDPRLDKVYWTLRLTYGLVPVVAGLDKFLGLLADWDAYLSPAFAAVLPFEASTLMALVGIIEIAAGLVVLAWKPRLGAWIVAVWLLLIAVNLVLGGFYDVAVRDVVMAIGAGALARLAEVHEEQPAAAPARTAA
jgi:uncharacterized membrane protein YphA (DoxX/SURF4 family)